MTEFMKQNGVKIELVRWYNITRLDCIIQKEVITRQQIRIDRDQNIKFIFAVLVSPCSQFNNGGCFQ